jgi:hypothetical protein
MHTSTETHGAIVQLVPGGESKLAHLSDSELLSSTRSLVGTSNRAFAALLVHLAEVEARGLHRTRACSSLYTYCIYELRFSEDAAARRAGAARWVKRFPLLVDAVESGELHLTGLLMLGPHLSAENCVEVLARAKFRTKKELAKLVRELHPLPLIPDLIEPLRPAPAGPRNPSWQEFVSALAPAVRELPPGERPRDWANDTEAAAVAAHVLMAQRDSTAPARAEQGPTDQQPTEPARPVLPTVTGPQQYQLQFSTTEEHVQLVERAKALLARQAPGQSLGELHLQAMRLLVAALEKQKYGASPRPRASAKPASTAPPHEPGPAPNESVGEVSVGEVSVGEVSVHDATDAEHALAPDPFPVGLVPRRRVRYVPAGVRRAVFERDEARCTYVDERGVRCSETRYLELHHRHSFAQGGPHSVANLTLYCPAHNTLAAEQDFGRECMAARSTGSTHESRRSQGRPETS